jgi:hypothetical protein
LSKVDVVVERELLKTAGNVAKGSGRGWKLVWESSRGGRFSQIIYLLQLLQAASASGMGGKVFSMQSTGSLTPLSELGRIRRLKGQMPPRLTAKVGRVPRHTTRQHDLRPRDVFEDLNQRAERVQKWSGAAHLAAFARDHRRFPAAYHAPRIGWPDKKPQWEKGIGFKHLLRDIAWGKGGILRRPSSHDISGGALVRYPLTRPDPSSRTHIRCSPSLEKFWTCPN